MFDLELFQFINGFSNQSALLDWIMVVIAEFFPYIAGIVVLVVLFRVKTWKEKIRLFIVLSFSLLLARGLIFEIIRYFYSRPRPFIALQISPLFLENSFAFPSSHAIVLTVFGCVMFLTSRKWGIVLLVFAGVNAIARIYSGVHWPTDVLAGIVIALCAVYVSNKVFPKNSSTPLATEV